METGGWKVVLGDVELAFLAAVLDYCRGNGASVTSWIRTPTRNQSVGGVRRSLHVAGLAVDVVYDKTPDLADAIASAGLRGLRVHREGDHDHLEPIPGAQVPPGRVIVGGGAIPPGG